MIVGFDVGGTNARGLVIDSTSHIVVDRDRRASGGHGPQLLETLAAMVSDFRRRAEIEAIGLGVAGLAHESGTIRYSPNLPDLVEYPLGTELSEATGAPVTVVNDATAATWAEARLGAGRGCDDFVFIGLGTGIGSGFVSDGRLVRGANGFAGESGHMQVDLDGPTHRTGQMGPWEYFASGTALGRMGREAAAAGRFSAGVTSAGGAGKIVGFHVAEAVADGDPEAMAILDTFGREVARGVANLVLVVDPARVVIGGGLSDVGEPLRAAVDRWLPELTIGAAHRPAVEVVIAELGDDAGALGAGLLAAQA